MDYKKLGEILRNARTNLGLNQTEVSSKLGKTSQNLSSWELGKSRIDIESLAFLCELYKISFVDTLCIASDSEFVSSESHDNSLSPIEQAHIDKYRPLPDESKKRVDNTLDFEYDHWKEKQEKKQKTEPTPALTPVTAPVEKQPYVEYIEGEAAAWGGKHEKSLITKEEDQTGQEALREIRSRRRKNKK